MIDDGVRVAAALHEQILALGKDVTSEWKAGGVRYARSGVLFSIVKPLARRCDVGFTKLGRARSTRIRAAKGRLPFVRHLVEVEALGDIDRELGAWLQEAYETAGGQ